MPPSSPDRGAPDSDGYSTVSETVGCQHRHRGSRERKRLAPMRLDMPIFKSTDPGMEVMYTLWRFDVDAFLKQYDEASMCPHTFTSFHGYPSKWAHTLDEGKDISVQDLLMHMEKTFGNKHNYDAMIRTLYEVQQRDDETVEEYMLHIHEAVAMIRHVYPEHLPDRGQDLKKDHFYHGLCPYLHDALSFAMAELPKREQACPTFDTLYTLTKMLEVGQLVHMHRYTTSSEAYREKPRCYLMPVGRVAALEEEGLALTDPVTGKDSESEVEAVGGLNVHLAQVMGHYQREEQQCFICGLPGHFTQGCPHHKAFRRWHRDQANSKGVGESSSPALGSVSSQPEVNVHMIGWIQNPQLEAGGPTSHWIRPEMLVELTMEGRNFNALADSGSQVNTITPALAQQYGFPVLPLEDLVDYPLNLVGLGGKHTSLLGFVILHNQVQGITGYDKDAVFLVVPNESNFGRRVPLVVGTCTISRMISIIRESEIDGLAMPWSTTRVTRLLSCQLGMAIPTSEGAETLVEGASGGSPERSIDELVMVWESIHLGSFQTKIIEGRFKPLLRYTSYVMITPLRAESRPQETPWETKPLPPGLHILHAYTHLNNGSERVSLVVRNVSDSHIFLKKGMPVARVVSASLVLPMELSLEMEVILGVESQPEPMSVAARQEKLPEKLNLDRLANWFPENAMAVRELVLAYHDVFVLESNELGCTSAIEHEIHIENDEPFIERFQRIPPPLLEEVRTSHRDMLEAGAIHPSQSHWCNMVILVQKKDSTLRFCMDFRHLNVRTKKDSYPLPQIQEALEIMVGLAHFSSMDFKLGFWQIKMAPGLQQYTAFMVGNLGFYEFARMSFRLCNAPATFQHLMQNTLGELNLTYCVIYLHDVIVFGCMEEEHLEHLCMVFKRFQEFNLKLKSSKCSFFQSEIVYLAHHISWRAILPSRENVWAVQEFPMLKTYTQVKMFCRLVGHYRRFIKGFANIACPLYHVLGKE